MDIKLSNSEKMVMVDEQDYASVNKYKWYAKHGDAVRTKYMGGGAKHPINKTITMHRWLMNTPEGMDTDHINGDRLDNRRGNLRICTRSENKSNQSKCKTRNKYKGVYRNDQFKTTFYMVSIMKDGHRIYGGTFHNELDAARRYNELAIKHHGEFARINTI